MNKLFFRILTISGLLLMVPAKALAAEGTVTFEMLKPETALTAAQAALERWWRELAPTLHAARSNLLARRRHANAMGVGPESRSAACRALARRAPGAPDGVAWG